MVNEFDKKAKFYQMFNAERKIRAFAESFPNTFHLGIFACCRQIEDASMQGKLSFEDAEQYGAKAAVKEGILKEYTLTQNV